MNVKILSVKDLAEAEKEIKKIGTHPIGVKIMSLKSIHRLIKFYNVDPKTANIVKQEMLSRGGDAVVSRDVANFKEKPTDLIIMGTLAQYVRLIKKLKIQPYNCKKIAEKIESLLLKEGVNPNKAAVW
jgi:dihydropteroate synthase